MELDRLDALVSEENQSLAFATFAAGVFFTSLTSYMSAASQLSPRATAIFFAALFSSFAGMMWWGLSWLRRKKERPRLLHRIRARCAPRGSQAGPLAS